MNLKPILKTIRNAKSILISTHANPDPDALASELAMALFLKAQGKKVFIVNEEPVPNRFAFIPAVELIYAHKNFKKIDYDVAVVLDCGELERVGNVFKLIDRRKPLINIDHHITNDTFGTLNFVKPAASSTAEVLFELLKAGRCVMTKEIAVLLYLGIMTDTGSFRYENTSSYTHAIVSELLKFKFSIPVLYQKLYESVPLSDLKYFTKVVSNFESLYGGQVICVELPRKVVKKFSHDFDLRDKIFGFLRTVKNVEVIAIFTEDKPGRTRVNLRSQSHVNVAGLAHHFQGGGHSRASGCLVHANIKTAKRKLLKELKKVL